MTTIRFISDTHFDSGLNGVEEYSNKGITHTPFGHYFSKKLKEQQADVTLIAGDMAASIETHKLFLEGFFKDQQVIFVDGNHLVYSKSGMTLYELKNSLKTEFPKEHMFWHYLENDWMWIPNTNNTVAVIGSTFYTDYKYTTFTVDSYNEYKKSINNLLSVWGYSSDNNYTPIQKLTSKTIINENLLIAKESLNDFYWGYETKNTHLTPETYLKLNKLAKKEVIKCHNEITAINPEAKIILMTHHCLSPKCIDSHYVKSKSNASYVSDLENWITKNLPNVRLVNSGHVHCRKDFLFGSDKKRYIINACGYIKRNEPFINKKFNPNLIIDTNNL